MPPITICKSSHELSLSRWHKVIERLTVEMKNRLNLCRLDELLCERMPTVPSRLQQAALADLSARCLPRLSILT